jgi:predicted transcriptional regulator
MIKEVVLARVPPDVKAWLQEQAEFHCTSQNAIVVRALRAAIDVERREARATAAAAAE